MFFFSSPNRKSKYIYRYLVSSNILKSDISIPELAPFFKEKLEYKFCNYSITSNQPSNYSLIYKGPGPIGNSIKEISFYKQNNNYKLIISGTAKFLIKSDSEEIEIFLLDSEINLKNKLIIESLLGPVIIFCLALDGIFCFHATTVEYKNKAILFLGKSGSGKSTLVEYLDKKSDGQLSRIADDIVPITFIDNSLFALPHFLQLKLTNKQQYPLDKPTKVKISAIYLLKKDNRKKSVHINDIEPSQRIISLISNTVASRLFDRGLNKNHLEFCSKVVSSIPVKKIAFKHDKKCLPELCKFILDDIKASKDF